ncbi:MAG: helix-turn-helix domain-containing protein [Bacteroidales bacterium]|nr:helix-turn-helix domain-containing protein [Bacteroidales bacterium]
MEITEQKILHAAKKMFLTEGYHKTTTAALAKQAGVNQASIHYYFSDKETLYKIVF